jgi:hypothetical protein
MHAATFDYRQKQNLKRLEHFKISDEVISSYENTLENTLSQNPMTTKEIRKKLQTKDELSSILFYLADVGLIVRSKPRKNWMDRMHTYELFSEAVPNVNLQSISIEDAKRELIQKYIENYGPVCEQDIVWWTGFKKTTIRNELKNLEDLITSIDITPFNLDFFVQKNELEVLKDLQALHESVISVLPCLDPYIMGYKFRDRYIEEDGKEFIFDRSGNATNVITLNGKITGIWDWEIKGPNLKFFLFKEITKNQRNLVKTELEKLGKFLFESPFDIIEKQSMEPLTNRTAGWVLKPLRD